MTVADDLTLLAKLLPPSLSARYDWNLGFGRSNLTFLARYQVQLLWAADVNKDIGFNFSLREQLANEEKREDVELQLRGFNLENFHQSSAAATTCVLNAEEGIFTLESQEPNPGRLDTEMKDPKTMISIKEVLHVINFTAKSI